MYPSPLPHHILPVCVCVSVYLCLCVCVCVCVCACVCAPLTYGTGVCALTYGTGVCVRLPMALVCVCVRARLPMALVCLCVCLCVFVNSTPLSAKRLMQALYSAQQSIIHTPTNTHTNTLGSQGGSQLRIFLVSNNS